MCFIAFFNLKQNKTEDYIINSVCIINSLLLLVNY